MVSIILHLFDKRCRFLWIKIALISGNQCRLVQERKKRVRGQVDSNARKHCSPPEPPHSTAFQECHSIHGGRDSFEDHPRHTTSMEHSTDCCGEQHRHERDCDAHATATRHPTDKRHDGRNHRDTEPAFFEERVREENRDRLNERLLEPLGIANPDSDYRMGRPRCGSPAADQENRDRDSCRQEVYRGELRNRARISAEPLRTIVQPMHDRINLRMHWLPPLLSFMPADTPIIALSYPKVKLVFVS